MQICKVSDLLALCPLDIEDLGMGRNTKTSKAVRYKLRSVLIHSRKAANSTSAISRGYFQGY